MRDALTVPDPTNPIELTANGVSATVYPMLGGRIGQITVAGQPLLVEVPSDVSPSMGWGSFPMAPWAGRIGGGRFAFEGVEHQLVLNHVDADGGPGRSHSIHGTVFARAWTVDEQTATTLTMSSPLAGALDWPFGGAVHQRFDVASDHVDVELWIDTEEGRLPAELGWHPWFRKPDRLTFHPTSMYQRDTCGIPTGELVAPNDGPWDDCFVNTSPVVLHYDRPNAPMITVASDCDHWVVYDQPADATCVEPQSGPPDAFNLSPHLVSSTTPLRRTMTISW